MPTLTFAKFRSQLDKKITEYAINWHVLGFHAPGGRIYPIGTDTKVLSTIFEALIGPLVAEIAKEFNYSVEGSEQTVYPDFTLSPNRPPKSPSRIAIDIKTAYRRIGQRGQIQPFRYTLGSYTSFLRTPGAKKNIKYPYAEYCDHWTIGFLYTRTKSVAAKVYYRLDEENQISCPYSDVEYFVQEKYKIIGDRPGSGNTANIGSFPTAKIQDLRDGLGPFATLGKEMCDQYWRTYAREKAQRVYNNLAEFKVWFASQGETSS